MRNGGHVTFAMLIACAGCSANIDMFPVAGPLSEVRPLPVVKATAENVTSNSGRLIIALPDGQACEGRWSSVAPRMASSSTGTLMSTYGTVAGFSVGSTGILPGVNRGEAFASCSGGTTVDAEFFTGSGTANGYGIARDSDGNVYRMLF